MNAPKTALKVDNLRHLSDHGLVVSFTDQKLVSLVEYLRSRDQGTVTLSAGKSTLKVTRFGKVTRTEAFFSVGSYRVDSLHYLDGDLRYTLKRNGGSDHEEAYHTVSSVLFGYPLPSIWRIRSGADKDRMLTWLKTFQWTMTGEAGLRAQALEQAGAHLRNRLSSIVSGKAYEKRELERYKEENPVSFAQAREWAREHCQNKLSAIAEKNTLADSHLETLAKPDVSILEIAAISQQYGAVNPYYSNYREKTDEETQTMRFNGTHETLTPAFKRPNYSATVDGEKISFSSGIGCPFTLSALKAWLKGEAEAPRTTYGRVEKVETCDEQRHPKILLKCGCHYIDAGSACPDLAELLKPTHTVFFKPGKSNVFLKDTELFKARLLEEIAEKREQWKAEREGAIFQAAESRHQSTEREKNLPQWIAQKEQAIAKMDGDIAALETEIAKAPPEGATLKQTRETLVSIFTALTFSGSF